MNKVVSVISLVSLITLGGCASREIPSDKYYPYAQEWVYGQACFNEGNFTAREYSDFKAGWQFAIGTWGRFDPATMQRSIERVYASRPSTQYCYGLLTTTYDRMRTASARQSAKQRSREYTEQTRQNIQRNKPAFCTTVGLGGGVSTTTCN